MADFGISEVLSIAGAAGSLFKASGSYGTAQNYDATGAAMRQAAEFKAAQMRQQAGQKIAASQRQAIEDKNASVLMASKLIAAAGASGGTGPQVNRMVADIMAKGSYNRSMDLYNGEEASRALLMGAEAAEYQGRIDEMGAGQKAGAARTAGAGEVVTGAATLFSKYAGSGPKADAETGAGGTAWAGRDEMWAGAG